MSKYTTELRYICESKAGLSESADGAEVDDIIRKAAPFIFNFSYPIYNENHRLELECKILKRYYTREICAETYGRWKLFLNERMNSIMDYYNKLYESAEFEFNPMVDYKVTRVGSNQTTANASGNDKNNSTNNSVSWNLYSDTPQGAVTGIEQENYLTNATKDTNNNNANGSSEYSNNSSSDGTYNETVEGLAGGRSSSTLLKEYRKTIINIDNMIVDELKDLFMNIW